MQNAIAVSRWTYLLVMQLALFTSTKLLASAKCKAPSESAFLSGLNATTSDGEILIYVGKELHDDPIKASLARVGAAKALFHVSLEPRIDMSAFEDVSGETCLVYKVDLKKVWGSNWSSKLQVMAGQGLTDTSFDKSRQRFIAANGGAQESSTIFSARRVAYNITFPSNYNNLAELGSP